MTNYEILTLCQEEADTLIETLAKMRTGQELTLTLAEAAELMLRAEAEDFDG